MKISQIDHLKKRYDAMQTAAKKTGSVLYFEPLCVELNDCFGALKDVTPDAVYSNRRGLDENRSSHDEEDMGASGDGAGPSTSTHNEAVSASSKKKKSKSKYYDYLLQQ